MLVLFNNSLWSSNWYQICVLFKVVCFVVEKFSTIFFFEHFWTSLNFFFEQSDRAPQSYNRALRRTYYYFLIPIPPDGVCYYYFFFRSLLLDFFCLAKLGSLDLNSLCSQVREEAKLRLLYVSNRSPLCSVTLLCVITWSISFF